jgi:hypothetical protein
MRRLSVVPADHPLRQIRVLADRSLDRMDGEFSRIYARSGRPSIAPEKLLQTRNRKAKYPAKENTLQANDFFR